MKIVSRTCCLILAVGLLGLAGCGPQNNAGADSGENSGETINIDGSSTVYLISSAVDEVFSEENPGVNIVINFSGTGGGMKKFVEGGLDICDASRAMKDEEKKLCEENGVEYVELTVANDGIAVIAHKDNDFCKDLTVAQLKEIWRPESPIKQWKDINPDWPAEEIKLFGPGLDSGTFEYFTGKIVEKKKSSREDFQRNEDDNALATQIASEPYSLGYFGFAYYVQNKDKLSLISVDGQVPSKESIQNLDYAPLSRPLFIYVNKKSLERPEVKNFVDFYLNNCADLSERVGYVRLKDDEQAASRKAFDEAVASMK